MIYFNSMHRKRIFSAQWRIWGHEREGARGVQGGKGVQGWCKGGVQAQSYISWPLLRCSSATGYIHKHSSPKLKQGRCPVPSPKLRHSINTVKFTSRGIVASVWRHSGLFFVDGDTTSSLYSTASINYALNVELGVCIVALDAANERWNVNRECHHI